MAPKEKLQIFVLENQTQNYEPFQHKKNKLTVRQRKKIKVSYFKAIFDVGGEHFRFNKKICSAIENDFGISFNFGVNLGLDLKSPIFSKNVDEK